jgi:hypothetical protein
MMYYIDPIYQLPYSCHSAGICHSEFDYNIVATWMAGTYAKLWHCHLLIAKFRIDT